MLFSLAKTTFYKYLKAFVRKEQRSQFSFTCGAQVCLKSQHVNNLTNLNISFRAFDVCEILRNFFDIAAVCFKVYNKQCIIGKKVDEILE